MKKFIPNKMKSALQVSNLIAIKRKRTRNLAIIVKNILLIKIKKFIPHR